MEFCTEKTQHKLFVVSDRFCAPYTTELSIAGLSFSGSDFKVTDSNGKVVLKMARKTTCVGYRCLLQDAAGNTLLTMKPKMFSMHSRWEAFRAGVSPYSMLIFSARRPSVFHRGTRLNVFMAGNKDETLCDFHVKGSYCDRSCTIYRGDQIVAEMKNKSTVTKLLMWKDTVSVIMKAGVDYAFIVALIIVFDEINNPGDDQDTSMVFQ